MISIDKSIEKADFCKDKNIQKGKINTVYEDEKDKENKTRI